MPAPVIEVADEAARLDTSHWAELCLGQPIHQRVARDRQELLATQSPSRLRMRIGLTCLMGAEASSAPAPFSLAMSDTAIAQLLLTPPPAARPVGQQFLPANWPRVWRGDCKNP